MEGLLNTLYASPAAREQCRVTWKVMREVAAEQAVLDAEFPNIRPLTRCLIQIAREKRSTSQPPPVVVCVEVE